MNLAESFQASDLLVKALEAEGVPYVFGVPGEENLDFVESLRKSHIKLIVTRHEQTAGFMAATVGRLTGRGGVALSTLGPGATNLTTAAAYAFLGAFPMLMITGQKPVLKSKQGAFQIVDTSLMFSPITKWSKQVVHGGLVPSLVREAMRRANEERPGSVHLELPEDVACEQVLQDETMIFEPQKVRRPIAEQKAVAKLVELLQSARAPLLVIGAGANRKMTCKMLRKFVDQTKIPFVDTMMGKGVVDSRHEAWMGTTALSASDYSHEIIRHSDLIVLIGHDVVEKPPFIMSVSSTKKVVHLNYFTAQVDQVMWSHLEVIGDIANTMWQLGEVITEAPPSWDLRYFKYVKEHMLENFEVDTGLDCFPIAMPRLVKSVRAAVPDHDSIVCLDNGLYKVWFAREYPCYAPNSLLLDNALASMGAGVPSAMAAKLIQPEAHVFAIVGDGGFLMNGAQELLTAIDNDLHITILVVNDSAYGMIRWKQQGMELQDFGLELRNPNFQLLAQAYGAAPHKVESAADLDSVLEECATVKAVHVVEIAVDYSASSRTLQMSQLKEHLGRTLESPSQVMRPDPQDEAQNPRPRQLDARLSGEQSKGGDLDQLRAQIDKSTGGADDKPPAATTEGEGAGVTLSDIEKDTQEPDNTPYFMSDAAVQAKK